MSRKGQTITLSLEEGHKEQLERLAVDFGCTWGEKPNVSALVAALASGKLRIDYADAAPADNPKRTAILSAIALIQEGLSKLLRLL
jgi:hypothetical protein